MAPIHRFRIAALLILVLPGLATGQAKARASHRSDLQHAEEKAADELRQMTKAEKLSLVMGIIPAPIKGVTVPKDALISVGYVPGVTRLGIPSLKETDGSVGIAYVRGLRHDDATAFPWRLRWHRAGIQLSFCESVLRSAPKRTRRDCNVLLGEARIWSESRGTVVPTNTWEKIRYSRAHWWVRQSRGCSRTT